MWRKNWKKIAALALAGAVGFGSGCGTKVERDQLAGSFRDAVLADAAISENTTSTPRTDAVPPPVTSVGTPTPEPAQSAVMPNGTPPSKPETTNWQATSDDPTPETDPVNPSATPTPNVASSRLESPSPTNSPASETSPDPGSNPTSLPKPAADTNNGLPQLTWDDFFDHGDQTTPSNWFWELSEAKATVQITGFMGEVLSLDKNWFLLIPEPGAECPFDNGDETYWNKIMIVFVKDGTKLRYTSKPLKLTGRLDVGVKVDESGYKTMFRLYDAKYEEL